MYVTAINITHDLTLTNNFPIRKYGEILLDNELVTCSRGLLYYRDSGSTLEFSTTPPHDPGDPHLNRTSTYLPFNL